MKHDFLDLLQQSNLKPEDTLSVLEAVSLDTADDPSEVSQRIATMALMAVLEAAGRSK